MLQVVIPGGTQTWKRNTIESHGRKVTCFPILFQPSDDVKREGFRSVPVLISLTGRCWPRAQSLKLTPSALLEGKNIVL